MPKICKQKKSSSTLAKSCKKVTISKPLVLEFNPTPQRKLCLSMMVDAINYMFDISILQKFDSIPKSVMNNTVEARNYRPCTGAALISGSLALFNHFKEFGATVETVDDFIKELNCMLEHLRFPSMTKFGKYSMNYTCEADSSKFKRVIGTVIFNMQSIYIKQNYYVTVDGEIDLNAVFE